MATKVDVTSAQANDLRVMANQKGITRYQFQQLLGNGHFAKILDEAKQSIPISAPKLKITVDLGAKPGLPFNGAIVETHIGEGTVTIEKCEDGLYMDGRKVILHLSERQQDGKWMRGHELRDELTGKPVLNANVADALYENPHLIPEDWKKDERGNIRYIFFWGTIFRRDGRLYVGCLCFRGRSWHRRYNYSRCLGRKWRGDCPSALLAS